MTWGKPIEDAAKSAEDKVATLDTNTDDQTENETGMTKEEKETRRYQREGIKHSLLQLAHNSNDQPQTVVERAKAYYSFVTGKKVRS